MNVETLDKVFEDLHNQSEYLFTRVTRVYEQNYIAIYEGSVYDSSFNRYAIQLCFSKLFPLDLPDCYLVDQIPNSVHIFDRNICYCTQENLLISQDNLTEVIIYALEQIKKTLDKKLGTAEYDDDLKREFQAYWKKDCKLLYRSIIPLDNVEFRSIHVINNEKLTVISKSYNDAEDFFLHFERGSENKKINENSGLIIRLNDKIDLSALSKLSDWISLQNYIIANTSSKIRAKFINFIKRKTNVEDQHLFIIVPNIHYEILLGYLIHKSDHISSRLANMRSTSLIKIYIDRIDANYLRTRGGNMVDLSNKKVLLLGCGSIGGYIAENLIRSGIEYLSIIDQDVFLPVNIYRHVIGYEGINLSNPQFKSDIMKEHLERNYPNTKIESISTDSRRAEIFIQDLERLKGFDLIISALGSPTANIYISRILIENSIKIPFVVCFNEPYGIGGHIICSNIDDTGCQECLYTDISSSDISEYRGSFVENGQSFQQNLAGCGTAYTPYSCLDSQQTAILAIRYSISILLCNLSENCIVSWIGDDTLIQNNGYKTSARYNEYKYEKFIQTPLPKNLNCHCSRGEK